MKNKLIRLAKPLTFIACLILLWQILYWLKIWPKWLFPSPADVWLTLVKGFANHTFIWGILISLKRIFIGFGVSIIIGTLLGFLIAKIKLLRETVDPIILGLQTLPSICWLPLALLWFGLNEKAIIFVVLMGTVLSLTISVKGAVLNIPPILINAGKMLGADGLNLYRYILIPAILPSYLTGLKHGWSFAWRSLMSGEMLFISVGLGQLLMFGRELNDMAQVMAVMLVIIVIGVIFDQLIFGKIEKNLRAKWGL
ncbi:MAG: ABC transporter permease [Candidatus Komeilibacteria bacterium]|nr:ABC transporter permease [Candidatus Komeilibacteria bacterium]